MGGLDCQGARVRTVDAPRASRHDKRAPMRISVPRTHNQGPPLDDEHVPEWGADGIETYFYWKKAHKAVWKEISWDVMGFRQEKAEALGLTFEEYTLELLDHGRHLQATDTARIAAIKAARG